MKPCVQQNQLFELLFHPLRNLITNTLGQPQGLLNMEDIQQRKDTPVNTQPVAEPTASLPCAM